MPKFSLADQAAAVEGAKPPFGGAPPFKSKGKGKRGKKAGKAGKKGNPFAKAGRPGMKGKVAC